MNETAIAHGRGLTGICSMGIQGNRLLIAETELLQPW